MLIKNQEVFCIENTIQYINYIENTIQYINSHDWNTMASYPLFGAKHLNTRSQTKAKQTLYCSTVTTGINLRNIFNRKII